jgi:hypothetical protein
MNADARVIAPVLSSCMCLNAASVVHAVRAPLRRRAMPTTLPRAGPGAECGTGMSLRLRRPELARRGDLERALLKFRARSGNQIEHRCLFLRAVPPLMSLCALAEPVYPVYEIACVIG